MHGGIRIALSLCLEKEAQMNPKISWSSGLALTVLLVSAALTACGYKTTTYSTPPTAVALARYNANGTPDTAFGNNGITVTSLPSASAHGFAATLQADGKLLVAGRSSSNFLLLRYTTSGALDTANFGAPLGYVITAIPFGSESGAEAIALSGSNILIAGHSKKIG